MLGVRVAPEALMDQVFLELQAAHRLLLRWLKAEDVDTTLAEHEALVEETRLFLMNYTEASW